MMSHKLNRLLAASLLTVLLLSLSSLAQSGRQRRMSVDDFLRFEDIGETVLSDDGEWLAYVVMRSRESHRAKPYITLFGRDRGDIWVAAVRGGRPRRLTNGAEDASGYFAPLWSPNGQRLAMLSTKGGDLRPWLWEKGADEIRPLTDRNIGDWLLGLSSPVWISNNEILCCVLAKGQRPREMTYERGSPGLAMRAWPRAWAGQEPTASVLESGLPISAEQRPQRELRVINVDSGSHRVIASGDIIRPSLSPDKRHVAFARFVHDSGVGRERMPVTEVRTRGYRFSVARLDGESVLPVVPEIMFSRYRVFWNTDGSEFAMIGNTSDQIPANEMVFRINLNRGSVEAVTGNELDPSNIAWTASHQMLVHAARKANQSIPAEGATNRADWWLIMGNGSHRNLTASLGNAPRGLELDPSGRRLIGVAEGEIWQIEPEAKAPVNLTERFKPGIVSIVLRPKAAGGDANELIVRTGSRDDEQLYSLNLGSATGKLLSKPTPTATITCYSSGTDVAVFKGKDRFGSRSLYLVPEEGTKPTLIAETNAYLREMAQPELKKFQYRGLDGKTLIAWMLLPVGYESGKQYPMVTFVYPEKAHGEELPYLLTIDGYVNVYPFCLPLLAAHGYVVLFPSGGLGSPYGKAGDPYFDLPNGVLPAVDKVIEMGVADPERIGLLGHSFGGFATYGLVTQTNRFKAAVAAAGITDLVSIYGIFPPEFRYFDSYEVGYQVFLAESGQLRMGRSLWENYDRYRRNSPINYVERVETPIMMIHGDMDVVPLQQAEEFFTALERRNKRARFVRYWGEGHDPQSPANIKDMWQRIFDWFDELLKGNGRAKR